MKSGALAWEMRPVTSLGAQQTRRQALALAGTLSGIERFFLPRFGRLTLAPHFSTFAMDCCNDRALMPQSWPAFWVTG